MINHRVVFWLFVSAFLYFFVGGLFSYLMINNFDFKYADITYSIDLWTASGYSLMALVTFVLAYFTLSKIRFSFGSKRIIKTYVAGSVEFAAFFVVFIVGLFGFVLMMFQYGGRIPALVEGSDEFRTQISSGLPQVLYFQMVSAISIGYALIWHMTKRIYKNALVVLIAIGLTIIFLGASRSMFLTPIIVIGLDLWRRGTIGGARMFSGVIICGLAAFVIGLYRMGSTDQQGLYILRFITDFSPEFREFGKLLDYVPDKAPYLNGQMFINAVLILFPGKLLALAGMSKAQYWQPFGMFMKDLFNYQFAGGGLRAGLIAEFFANFGAIGIVFGFFSLGGVASWLDKKISNSDDVIRMFYLITGFSVATSILFTFDAVIYKIISLMFGWLLFWILSSVLSSLSTGHKIDST
ncbi:MAG: hypothetical protein DRP47_03625 [Candidatus Zixiibacteriota bacterium]|nr:MAG: hypothetical protein DRP47_03625 [candidate division Zixibacteria bacterium]